MIKVLIVEDDPMVARINRRYVESIEGFEITGVAKNGEEALVLIQELMPDLLILDIYMPKKNGRELLKQVRREGHNVDVILVTAEKDAASIDEMLKWGAVDYLVKPFEFPRFKRALLSYRERRRALGDMEEADQGEIDKIFSRKEPVSQRVAGEKGYHFKTMERIKKYMLEIRKPCTATEVAKDLGMARVTVRRYLEYMADQGELHLEVDHGKVGRPKHLYRIRE